MNEGTSLPVPLEPLPDVGDERRLWIGNLDPRVTDYWFTLLKLLQKFGTIEKFDLLFHHSGPQVGQPRGYAFVTYISTDDAKIAMTKLNGTLLGTKSVSVKWAHNITKSDTDKLKTVPDIPALAGAKKAKSSNSVTTIQAIEAKLKNMEKSKFEFEISNKPSITGKVAHVQNQSRSHDRSKRKPYNGSKWK